jgi:opacity protein-like surface antigen
MQLKAHLFVMLGCLFSASIANAGTMGADGQKHSNGTINFSLGAFSISQGTAQHIDIQGLIGNDFTLTRKTDQNVLLGLGYFFEGFNRWGMNLSPGLNAFYLFKTQVKGSVIQESLFENLAYQYSVRHVPVYASLKTTITPGSDNYAMTLDAGIGPNFITSSGFSERSLDGGITIPDYPFNSHTKTVFSATAGIGIQFNNLIGNHVGLGYRFFYLGQGNFVPRSEQILNTLNTGRGYANALVLTLSV